MLDDDIKCNRPIAYTTQIGDKIFDRLVEGQSISAICADAGMPSVQTLRLWFFDEEDFREVCAEAIQVRVDDTEQLHELLFGEKKPRQIEPVRGRKVRVDDVDDPGLAHSGNDSRMWLMRQLLDEEEE